MTTHYFIVEGHFIKFLLERILPEDVLAESKIITGNNYQIALSKARSILISSTLPITLIVNADTLDDTAIEEKKEFLEQSLRQFSGTDRFNLFLAVPKIEQIFFVHRNIMEEMLGKTVTEPQWQMAIYHPEQVLQELLNTNNIESPLHSLLTPDIITKLQHTQLVQKIIESIRLFSEAA